MDVILASEIHILAIKQIANQYKRELGFINRAALLESIERGSLWVVVANGDVVGFANTRRRRDGVTVVYEIAVSKTHVGTGYGRAMLDALERPLRLKCPVGQAANVFYLRYGFTLVNVEEGKTRALNVWELR